VRGDARGYVRGIAGLALAAYVGSAFGLNIRPVLGGWWMVSMLNPLAAYAGIMAAAITPGANALLVTIAGACIALLARRKIVWSWVVASGGCAILSYWTVRMWAVR
jgi:hypothetical protein